ncbi:flagellar hook-length control protein FliK [Paracerasibacillus soli]|uniref:Flagellar hook-length control protein FliK n=1 Tax=Paracerasibacillus soli TaxID=480284 RepID=A0ABU5CP69_9BACI|nr:flagellar hook-length control protein FliK [Virgibacillus soli]MDY0408163.1 flagellar hook-length control protein FliK [Virgibacillus soli]
MINLFDSLSVRTVDTIPNLEDITGNEDKSAKYDALIKQIQSVLAKVDSQPTEAEIRQVAPKVLALLEQWIKLTKADEQGSINQGNEMDSDMEMNWKSLVNLYQNRMQIAENSPYKYETKVTVTDVAKWLKQIGVTEDQEISVKNDRLIQQIQSIFAEMNSTSTKSNLQLPQRVLTLLEQWTQLVNVENPNQLVKPNGLDSKSWTTWKTLVSLYENQMNSPVESPNHSEIGVKATDIAEWLKQVGGEDHRVIVPHVPNQIVSSPMSKVEQFYIYMDQNQNQSSSGEQLIDRIQMVLNRSHFLKFAQGNSPLLISIRPENLGDMMLRFTQINGETAIKILVSTQATKELLEANMKQLKHAFAPHQIVIERQDVTASTQDTDANEANQESHDQQEQRQSHDHKQEDAKDNAFNDHLSEFLMNEEV